MSENSTYSSPLDSIYQALFSPSELYTKIAHAWPQQSTHFFYAICIVFFTAMIGYIMPQATHADFSVWTVLFSLFSGVMGILTWILTAMTFAALAYTFRSQAKLIVLLVLTGYAILPWIFLAPLFLLKTSFMLTGGLGTIFLLVGIGIIWVWTTVLFVMALQKTYQLPVDKTVIMTLIPGLMLALSSIWIFGGIGSIFTFFG